MNTVILIFLLILPLFCNSAELNVGVHTEHILGDNMNENNQLIALSNKSFTAGTMVNSYNIRSYFIARDFTYWHFKTHVGIVSGYNVNCMKGDWSCKESDLFPLFAVSYEPIKSLKFASMANAVMMVISVPLEVK
jgi:hypothetical protein